MQLTDEFASTFQAGDWIEFTDDQGNRLSGTLVADEGNFALSVAGKFIIPVVMKYWVPNGEATHFFHGHITKLHSFRRARRRVVVGDHLDGIEERLIVPTATQVQDVTLGLYVWSGSGEWVQVEATKAGLYRVYATLEPDQIMGEVVYVP